jgi:hypothetical protein
MSIVAGYVDAPPFSTEIQVFCPRCDGSGRQGTTAEYSHVSPSRVAEGRDLPNSGDEKHG